MNQIILLLIFLASLAGVIFIVYRRIPSLLELSAEGEEVQFRKIVVSSARNLVNSRRVRALASEKILQKALSKTRLMAMKTENQTGEWLEKLRQRPEERKAKFTDSYWDQFKKKRTKKNTE